MSARPPSDVGCEDANIRAIVELERAALDGRSRAERLSDAVIRALGSSAFLLLHVLWFGFWLLAGLGKIPGLPTFDPFPFSFLTMVVSLEAIFLAIFVLISQNRMARLADHRAHLDLQINLLAEAESTATLRLLQAVARSLGVRDDAGDASESTLSATTDILDLAKELETRLPSAS